MIKILLLLLPFFIFDRLTKVYFWKNYSIGESHKIIDGILSFTLVTNKGVAFGLFSSFGIIFLLLAIIVTLIIGAYLFCYREKIDSIQKIALILILAGTAGNAMDRIMYGFIIDFIDFGFWPVFNLADSYITVGVTMLIAFCLSKPIKKAGHNVPSTF